MEKIDLVVDIDEPMRLDAYLAEELEWASRSTVQKWIKNGCILLRGTAFTKPGKKVYSGEHLIVFPPEPEVSEIIAENIPLDIVYDDPYLVIVNKQPGLVVHPGAGHPRGTMANALLYHFKELSVIDSRRPGIVHRLDKETSGLIIAAKDNRTHWKLSEMLADRKIKRLYWGLVIGSFDDAKGRIESFMGRDPHNRIKMAVLSQGKHAVTTWETLETFNGFSLVAFRLFTGRTHQIRVHASYMRHPILGDSLYGGLSGKRFGEKAGRQMLHSRELEFIHPITGQCLRFTGPLHSDMEEILECLRSS